MRELKKITEKIIAALHITGPFNIQFIAKNNQLKVIECNVRASRSFPFVSKVSGYNFIEIATRAMLGHNVEDRYHTLILDHVGVKNPQFSYNRLKGADPVASVEMASTGEVACIGTDLEEAFFRSWLATDINLNGKSLFLSVPDSKKTKYIDAARRAVNQGWKIYATTGTHKTLNQAGIPSQSVYKLQDKTSPSVKDLIDKNKLSLMISVPNPDGDTTDAFTIRRLGIDNHIPLITNAESGRLLMDCLARSIDPTSNPQPLDFYL